MKKLVIALHVLIIILAYSSPFWLDWRLVTLGVLLYWVQIIVFKHCILSTAQFGDKETTFHEWYLSKVGIKPNHQKMKRILNIWNPLVLIGLSLILQLLFDFHPLVGL